MFPEILQWATITKLLYFKHIDLSLRLKFNHYKGTGNNFQHNIYEGLKTHLYRSKKTQT